MGVFWCCSNGFNRFWRNVNAYANVKLRYGEKSYNKEQDPAEEASFATNEFWKLPSAFRDAQCTLDTAACRLQRESSFGS